MLVTPGRKKRFYQTMVILFGKRKQCCSKRSLEEVGIVAYESEVRRQVGILRDSIRRTQNERNRVKACVDNSHQWWKGKGGEAFAAEYNQIDSHAARFMSYMDRAAEGLNRLPALIKRAEEERRKEAEKKAVLAAKKA